MWMGGTESKAKFPDRVIGWDGTHDSTMRPKYAGDLFYYMFGIDNMLEHFGADHLIQSLIADWKMSDIRLDKIRIYAVPCFDKVPAIDIYCHNATFHRASNQASATTKISAEMEFFAIHHLENFPRTSLVEKCFKAARVLNPVVPLTSDIIFFNAQDSKEFRSAQHLFIDLRERSQS